jgi:hypothetical protein
MGGSRGKDVFIFNFDSRWRKRKFLALHFDHFTLEKISIPWHRRLGALPPPPSPPFKKRFCSCWRTNRGQSRSLKNNNMEKMKIFM